MALSIKDEETDQLARELARRMGETVTTAVKIALKERLERQEEDAMREKRMAWLEEITAYTSKVMDDGRTTKELFDELYDEETGLPK
jgi:antitoxin VapB